MSLGWGDDAWGDNGWGGTLEAVGVPAAGSVGATAPQVTVDLSGVAAGGAVGDVVETNSPTEDSATASGFVGTVGSNLTVALAGVNSVGSVGTVDHGKELAVTGVGLAGEAGTVSRGNTLLAMIGVTAQGQIESFGVDRDITVSGNPATGAVQSTDIATTLFVLGVEAQGTSSQVIVPLNSQTTNAEVGFVGLAVTIELTGVQGQGASGTLTVAPRLLGITGTSALGAEGDVIAVYWQIINDTQVPNWQNIISTQGTGWTDVNDTQTPNWQDVLT